MSERLFHLMERHQKIDAALEYARRSPTSDPLEITRLKKLKLAIKDRLARLLRRAVPQR